MIVDALDHRRVKAAEIHACLTETHYNNVVNLWKLRTHALTKGGLLNDEIRKLAWPRLVGLDEEALNCDASFVL